MASKILCIIDGATDEHFNIDSMLKPYHLGYFETTPKGMETESSSCIMNLLGVKEIPGNARAWLEAIGHGIALEEDDKVMRTSMVKVDADMRADTLCNRSDEVDIPGYHSLGSYKGIYITKGDYGVDFPVHKHMGERIPDDLGIPQPFKAEGTYLVPWAPSIPPNVEERIRGFAITGIDLVKGIAMALGMDCSDEEVFTGDVDTDVDRKIELALEKAESEDFVLLHFNGTDEAGHRLDEAEKAEFREVVISKVIEKLLKSNHDVIVTSDHGTSPITGRHMNIKQPYYGNFDIRFKEDEGVREWLKR